jgi:hypothetical protein
MLFGGGPVGEKVDVQVRTLARGHDNVMGMIVGVHQDRHPGTFVDAGIIRHAMDCETHAGSSRVSVSAAAQIHEVAPDTLLGGKKMGRPVALFGNGSRDRAADGEDDKGLIQREGDFVGHFLLSLADGWRTLKKQYEEIRRLMQAA